VALEGYVVDGERKGKYLEQNLEITIKKTFENRILSGKI